MQAGVNAAAAPPHVQQQQPLRPDSARAATTGTTSFASASAIGLAVGSAGMSGGMGVGGAAPSVSYGGTAGGGTYGHGTVGIKRVGVAPGPSDGSVAANTRKKSRLG